MFSDYLGTHTKKELSSQRNCKGGWVTKGQTRWASVRKMRIKNQNLTIGCCFNYPAKRLSTVVSRGEPRLYNVMVKARWRIRDNSPFYSYLTRSTSKYKDNYILYELSINATCNTVNTYDMQRVCTRGCIVYNTCLYPSISFSSLKP